MLSDLIKNYLSRKEFIKNNKSVFFNKDKKNSKILVEFNAYHPVHIAISYLANVIAKKNKSEINAFYNYSLLTSPIKNTIFNEFKWKIGNFFSLKNFGIYRSFGVKKIFKPTLSLENEGVSEKYFNKIYSKIKNKEDVLKIKFDGILVGDLIYDTYLKHYIKPTLDIKSQKFYFLLKNFILLYLFWKSYFKNNKVSAVIGAHTPYSFGLILRMAIQKKIPTYATSSRFVFYLNKDMPYMHGQFKSYAKTFQKFDDKIKIKALSLAKKKLKLRFNGMGGAKVDLISSEKSSFGSKKFKQLIKSSNKIKVLIFPHDFFDAVHVFGNTLFADFYEWLMYLGKLSEKTNYDWYIKNRPNYDGKFKIYQPATNKYINDIIKKFPKIKLLPNTYSHHQIIKEKVDFALTCYGSVGVEYPYFNISTINASKNNPHINYKFNYHPKTKKEYESLIKNLHKIKKAKKVNFSKSEIHEYYFMRHIYMDKNWLFDDLQEMINFVGGYDGQFKPRLYKYWIKKFSDEKHNRIIGSLNRFIDSKENYLNINHSEKFNKLLNH